MLLVLHGVAEILGSVLFAVGKKEGRRRTLFRSQYLENKNDRENHPAGDTEGTEGNNDRCHYWQHIDKLSPPSGGERGRELAGSGMVSVGPRRAEVQE